MKEQDPARATIDRSVEAGTFCFGPYRFDARERVLYNNGSEVQLPLRALSVLERLLHGSGQIVAKEELLELWGDISISENSLTEAISLIRKELGDTAEQPTYIQTLRGRGYRFIAELSVQHEAVDSAVPRLASQVSGIITRVAVTARRHQLPIAWSLVAVLPIVAAVATWLWRPSSTGPAPQVASYLSISLPPDLPHVPDGDFMGGQLWISRDGARVAYVAGVGERQIVIRDLGRREFSPIPGTEGVRSFAFSPDGDWVAFSEGEAQDGSYRLKKVALDGSTPVTLGPANPAETWIEAWGARGIVARGIVDRDAPIVYIVPAEGGSAKRLAPLAGNWLSILPDGKTALLTAYRPPEPTATVVISRDGRRAEDAVGISFPRAIRADRTPRLFELEWKQFRPLGAALRPV